MTASADGEVLDVLVVGAGPTGLALAATLRRYGVRFRVVDRALDRVHESRALAIQPRTLELLAGLGVTDQLVAHGNRTVRLRLHAGRRTVSMPLFDIGLDDTSYPYLLFLSQAETERVLADHLAQHGVRPERGVELVGMEHARRQCQLQAPVRQHGRGDRDRSIRGGLRRRPQRRPRSGRHRLRGPRLSTDLRARRPRGRRHRARYRPRVRRRPRHPVLLPARHPGVLAPARHAPAGWTDSRRGTRHTGGTAGARRRRRHDVTGAAARPDLGHRLPDRQPRRHPLPIGTSLPGWRRRPHPQPGRRARYEHGHPGRRQPRLEAWPRRHRPRCPGPAGHLRARACTGRAPRAPLHRPRLHHRHVVEPADPHCARPRRPRRRAAGHTVTARSRLRLPHPRPTRHPLPAQPTVCRRPPASDGACVPATGCPTPPSPATAGRRRSTPSSALPASTCCSAAPRAHGRRRPVPTWPPAIPVCSRSTGSAGINTQMFCTTTPAAPADDSASVTRSPTCSSAPTATLLTAAAPTSPAFTPTFVAG